MWRRGARAERGLGGSRSERHVARVRERPNTVGLGRRGRPVLLVRAWVATGTCQEGREAMASGPGITRRRAAMQSRAQWGLGKWTLTEGGGVPGEAGV
jgi:hypothetical protein